MGYRSLVGTLAPALALLVACGGGKQKQQPDKPVSKPATQAAKPPPPPETEADREKKRHDLDQQLVPPSACLPDSLKDQTAPRLELSAIAGDAVLCAQDTDRSRLLGNVGCWKIDLKAKALAYMDPVPLPGRGYDVLMDDRCARGYCVPSDAKLPGDHIAHIVWSLDKKPADDAAGPQPPAKVAVLTGDEIHVFDANTKVQSNVFSIRGDKGVTSDPTGIDFVADTIFVEASDASGGAVWVFKADGTQVGPITPIGAKETDKPINTKGGSFSILDHDRVAIAEQGFSQMTVYEVSTGKRTRAVRKPRTLACKPAEVDTYWKGGDKVTDKCRESIDAEITPWVGAEAIAGAKNLLVVLRGARTGELGVVDPRSLIEDKAKLIKLPWCSAASGAAGAGSGSPPPAGK